MNYPGHLWQAYLVWIQMCTQCSLKINSPNSNVIAHVNGEVSRGMGNTEFQGEINVANGVLWKRPSCNVLKKNLKCWQASSSVSKLKKHVSTKCDMCLASFSELKNERHEIL